MRLIYQDRVSPEFCARVREISDELGTDPNNSMAVMYFETAGTFAPDICAGGKRWHELTPEQRKHVAVGLVQCTDVALEEIYRRTGKRYTREQLAGMTALEQLEIVQLVLLPYKGRVSRLEDLYASILWPRAVGKGTEYVLFESPSAAYEGNAGFDKDKDGDVDLKEVTERIRRVYEKGIKAI